MQQDHVTTPAGRMQEEILKNEEFFPELSTAWTSPGFGVPEERFKPSRTGRGERKEQSRLRVSAMAGDREESPQIIPKAPCCSPGPLPSGLNAEPPPWFQIPSPVLGS